MHYTLKIMGSARGYYIEVVGSTLYAQGSIGKRMDGTVGLTWSGTFLPPAADRAQVEAVIEQVMTSGVEQVITIGERPQPEPEVVGWRSPRGLTLAEEMDREDSDY